MTGYEYCIGIEIDPTYYAIAEKRIKQAQQQPNLFDRMEDNGNELLYDQKLL